MITKAHKKKSSVIHPEQFQVTASSGTGQAKYIYFPINKLFFNGSGSVNHSGYNIANQYDAIIYYDDGTNESVSCWTSGAPIANYSITNPYPRKKVREIRIGWFSYNNSNSYSSTMTYNGAIV